MTSDQAREIAILSQGIGRQIALLIDRQGRPYMVLIGDPGGIYIPDISSARRSTGRLRGLRLLHTHLSKEGLSQEDLMDLVFLRLDAMTVLTVDRMGGPVDIYEATLLPPNAENTPYRITGPVPYHSVETDYRAQVEAIEDELARSGAQLSKDATSSGQRDTAILVSVSTDPQYRQKISLEELADLADTAGVDSGGTMIQRVRALNPKTILGKGKLAELEVMALQANAGVILFDQELTPAQMRNLADVTERKILDRTQLILDIFAQHATSRSGKLQVELAQLQYTLPRLVGKNQALDRLMGGIGGRGPGETKLELDRRRVRDRITRIKKELGKLRKRRKATRLRRAKAGLPVVALVGYTNAGKSTLLNTLTQSEVLAENKLFATLDPTTRRLRFPQEQEIILTDTVGFIRKLPDELKEAFRATLEELEAADLLLHVTDAGHPELEVHAGAVEEILREMSLNEIPRILVLNKWDSLDAEGRSMVKNIFPGGIPASAIDRSTLRPLVSATLAKAFPGWHEEPTADLDPQAIEEEFFTVDEEFPDDIFDDEDESSTT
ncbi:GTPase HflX [Desulfobaculum bizertense]|uniref:GTPase HflX n=1 Tax=Desulfobaculum bizertense DSM 18034 TaxID=1121442 RepID=A0A1T4WQN7_9BACT|nr:GTPase HflX [Desulfobaculum bizertense]SKA79636.1 GTP-binding protein HflX [Desulfobaculum bizertense DSM 18034]